MPLTSLLKNRNSEVSQFMRETFPDTTPFLREARNQVREAGAIKPTNTETDYPWSTMGLALDYRVRYYFSITPSDELTAHRGARRLGNNTGQFVSQITDGLVVLSNGVTGEPVGMYNPDKDAAVGVSGELSIFEIYEMGREAWNRESDPERSEGTQLAPIYEKFFESLDALTTRVSPAGTKLSASDEDEINRHCVVLALLEEVYRGGLRQGSPLANPQTADGHSLVDMVRIEWLDDLRELSWEFHDRCRHLLSLPHMLNPTFEGSGDVGGADGDLIVDGYLIDIKTSVQKKVDYKWVWQLLGYVLLDYTDQYRINGVGLYMARQGLLIQWDLEEAIRGLSTGKASSIEDLRSQFMTIVQKARLGQLP